MKGWIYFWTAYRFGHFTVPACFEELDEVFDRLPFRNDKILLTHSNALLSDLGQNLCRRMADIELYAWYVSEAMKHPDTMVASVQIGTFLVGHFSACKSLLDAAAITLANIYSLGLSNKQMDFSRPKFWNQLKQRQQTVYDRYTPFKGLSNEVIEWRDSAVHRTTPLVVAHIPDGPDKTPRDKQEIRMVAKPDARFFTVVEMRNRTPWVDPLHFHRKWRGQLIRLCEEVCIDIRDSLASLR